MAGKRPVIAKEEQIEEIYDQLWSIPNLSNPRVQASHGGSHLVWICSDLVRERRIRPEDCYPIGKHQKIDKAPKTLSFTRDIWAGAGQRQTFVEAVKKKVMVEGGRWVWQVDKPVLPPTRQRPQDQRERFLGNQPSQGLFNRSLAPPIKQQQQVRT
jgi:hypothetical protein